MSLANGVTNRVPSEPFSRICHPAATNLVDKSDKSYGKNIQFETVCHSNDKTCRNSKKKKKKRFVETVITVGKKSGVKSHLSVCVGWGGGVSGGGGGGDRHLFQCEKQQSQSSKWARKKSPQWENSYLSHLCGKTVSHLCGKTVISVTSVAKQLSQSPLWENCYLSHLCGKTVISVTSVAEQLSQSPLWQNSYLSHLCGKMLSQCGAEKVQQLD